MPGPQKGYRTMTPKDRQTASVPAAWLLCAALLGTVACGTPTATGDTSATGEGDAATGDVALTDTQKPDIQKPDTVLPDVVGADGADVAPNDADAADGAADADTGDVADAADVVLNCPGAAWCPCTTNGDCETGKCLDTPDGQKCAPTCTDTGCPAGYACKLVGAQDPLSYCVSTHLSLCAPCVTNKDCQAQGVTSALCLDYGDDGHFCGGACSADSDCGAGYACSPVTDPGSGATVSQCKRVGDVCGCSGWAKAAGTSTGCAHTTSAGVCTGTRTCGPGGLGDCSAKVPVAEICNNQDDNCNAIVDDLPADATCGTGVCGGGHVVCAGNGQTVCSTAGLATSETCNGMDDDCDGQTDENVCDDANACTTDLCAVGLGCTHTASSAPCDDGDPCTAESCDKDSGTCLVIPQPGTCADGDACTSGDSCGTTSGGNWGCVPGPVIGCDDNNPCTADSCDPATGCVGLPIPATVSCYEGPVGTDHIGICVPGVFQCESGVLGSTCVGEVLPGVELCDGIDNSCNGVTDEGCHATSVALSFAAAQQTGNTGTRVVHVLLAPDRAAGTLQDPAGKVRVAWGALGWLMKLVTGN